MEILAYQEVSFLTSESCRAVSVGAAVSFLAAKRGLTVGSRHAKSFSYYQFLYSVGRQSVQVQLQYLLTAAGLGVGAS